MERPIIQTFLKAEEKRNKKKKKRARPRAETLDPKMAKREEGRELWIMEETLP